MQDRYCGDIGDFAKFGLLRALGCEAKLGIAWYYVADENHNSGGRHIAYLDRQDEWRHLDPGLFDELSTIVRANQRSIRSIERSPLFESCIYSSAPVELLQTRREAWFRRTLSKLEGCHIVFADPDNGLCDNDALFASRVKSTKRLPLAEAHALSKGRTAILYHHNSRFKGGHRIEIAHWLRHFSHDSYAIYWRRWSNRTFFVVNPTGNARRASEEFCRRWGAHAELIEHPDRA